MEYKPLLIIGLIALVIISTTLYLGVINTEQEKNVQVTEQVNNVKSTEQITAAVVHNSVADVKTVSTTDLAIHNTMQSCWVAYNGKVYDITNFLPKHKGSAEAIIPYCGTANEFEQAFVGQHGTKKASMLMKVGVFIGDFETKGALKQ